MDWNDGCHFCLGNGDRRSHLHIRENGFFLCKKCGLTLTITAKRMQTEFELPSSLFQPSFRQQRPSFNSLTGKCPASPGSWGLSQDSTWPLSLDLVSRLKKGNTKLIPLRSGQGAYTSLLAREFCGRGKGKEKERTPFRNGQHWEEKIPQSHSRFAHRILSNRLLYQADWPSSKRQWGRVVALPYGTNGRRWGIEDQTILYFRSGIKYDRNACAGGLEGYSVKSGTGGISGWGEVYRYLFRESR